MNKTYPEKSLEQRKADLQHALETMLLVMSRCVKTVPCDKLQEGLERASALVECLRNYEEPEQENKAC